MKLCIISPMFPLPGESPSFGPDNVVFNLVKGITKIEVDIHIDIITIHNDIKDPFVSYLMPNVIVHYCPKFKFLPRTLGDAFTINKAVKECNFDLIHSHSPIALLKVLNLDVPKILTLHGIYWKEKRNEKNIIRYLGYYEYSTYIFRKVLPKIDAFVAISPYAVNELKEIGVSHKIKKLYQINNPIEISFFSAYSNNPETKKMILYPARLTERKNQIAAIEAIKIIKEKIPDIKLVLTGPCDKKYLNRIKELASKYSLMDNIEYLGVVSRNKILELYQNASIVYLLSYQETQPMAILEAMATGTPVIASNIESNSHIIQHGITGYLVDSNDTNKIAEYTIKLLKNEEKRNHFGSKSKEIACEKYHPDIIARQTLELYYDVLR